MARIHCPMALPVGETLALPEGPARHVQVLRMQPGMTLCLFNGQGGQHLARIERMGRSEVRVQVLAHEPVEREAARPIHLLAGLTANERMDWLVEKATELGAASITPVMAERSVLKLKGERADKKLAHWQGVAVAAAEQCGRNRVTRIDNACTLAQWLAQHPVSAGSGVRLVLSLSDGTRPLAEAVQGQMNVTLLSGPEGGLSPAEEALALSAGFVPVTLGPRVLRAETAPLAVLAALALR